MGAVIFSGIVLVIIGVVVCRWQAARRRVEKLRALAAELGLEFSEEDPLVGGGGESRPLLFRGYFGEIFESLLASLVRPGWLGTPGKFGQFGALSRGDSRRAYNVLHGRRRGRELSAFDFRYSEGSGKNRHTHRLSAAAVTCDCNFQELVIRPEGFLDKLAAAVGLDDIDFESHEFSQKFYVKSPDRKFAYSVITAQMMEFLLGSPGWSLEMHGEGVLIWTGSRWSPAEFRAAIAVLEGFLERVPHFVWKDLGGTEEADRSQGP